MAVRQGGEPCHDNDVREGGWPNRSHESEPVGTEMGRENGTKSAVGSDANVLERRSKDGKGGIRSRYIIREKNHAGREVVGISKS